MIACETLATFPEGRWQLLEIEMIMIDRRLCALESYLLKRAGKDKICHVSVAC